MADRPILFSAPMVRALLDGRKTQTRRILKPQPGAGGIYADISSAKKALRIVRGDRLWVREAWARTNVLGHDTIVYRAVDTRTDYGGPWKPGIHMFRRDSRLTLTVTDVRVQRVNDIKGRDMIAEGVRCDGCYDTGQSACRDGGCFAQRTAFEYLWDSINGLGCFASNPWVAAYTFTVEHRNIDASRTEVDHG